MEWEWEVTYLEFRCIFLMFEGVCASSYETLQNYDGYDNEMTKR